eukprot:s104_g28.t1
MHMQRNTSLIQSAGHPSLVANDMAQNPRCGCRHKTYGDIFQTTLVAEDLGRLGSSRAPKRESPAEPGTQALNIYKKNRFLQAAAPKIVDPGRTSGDREICPAKV